MISISAFCLSYSQSLQWSFLVPPGIHHCWVGRQRYSMDYGVRIFPDTCAHDQQWESCSRPFDLKPNTLSTRPHAPNVQLFIIIFLVQVWLRTDVLRTPSSTRAGFELKTSTSWQYISCHWPYHTRDKIKIRLVDDNLWVNCVNRTSYVWNDVDFALHIKEMTLLSWLYLYSPPSNIHVSCSLINVLQSNWYIRLYTFCFPYIWCRQDISKQDVN